MIPMYYKTLYDMSQNTTNDQNQGNTSTLSTLNTTVSHTFQLQQPSPGNFDPPPLPPQYSIQITPHNSPQQGSSNTKVIKTLQVEF